MALMRGAWDQVLAEARECIRKAYGSPKGCILSSGCSLPLDTLPDHIIALMNAARAYGRFPIDPKQLIPDADQAGQWREEIERLKNSCNYGLMIYVGEGG